MKKICAILLLFPFVWASGQNTIGLPEIMNFSKLVYSAGTQNWDVKQDKNGIMFFANNEGLLTYDGNYWKIYALPNKTIVRSVEIAPDGKIYVGGQDEIGYFSPDRGGTLVYTSLLSKLSEKDKSFADVWDIVFYDNSIFFRSERKIFQLTNDHITVYSNTNWRFLGLSNHRLIAQTYNNELLAFSSGIWQPFITRNTLPKEFLVTSYFSIGLDSSFIVTLKNGIYLEKGNTVTRFLTPVIENITGKRIYAATSVDAENIVLATTSEGCFIINKKGNLVQSFSKKEGLQNNNILSVFLDKDKNIWLGLDNGIDFIAYNNAIKHIYPDNLDQGSGYTSMIFNNQLYMGTSNGLYKVPLYPAKDLSYVKGSFEPVEGSKGQVWSLSVVNNQLLMGHHEGAFIINNNKSVLLDNTTGFWTFLPFSNVWPSSLMIAGTYTGIYLFNYKNNTFIKNKVTIPFESARFITIQDNMAWIAHPYKGIYNVQPLDGPTHSVKLYNNSNGLFSINNNYIYQVKNRIVVSTENGLYEYNAVRDAFEPSEYFKNIFGNTSIRYLKEDSQGNIWFIHNKSLGVVDMTGSKPYIIYLPEMNNKMVSGFEHIYSYDANNIFLGAEKGFYHINYQQYKTNSNKIHVQIRSVKAFYKTDSLLYGGYETSAAPLSINYKWNSFVFDYSSPLYGQQANVEYSYRLEGSDKDWSEWTKKKEKEYTNLASGNYTFQIKARNNFGNESAISSYAFTVEPPWYQSPIAIIAYILLFIALSILTYIYLRRKFLLQQQMHREEQERLQYLHKLEMDENERKIGKLKIEKLEAEIQFKNKELASSAMHLIQKGELLTKIKDEFTKLQKNEEAAKEAEGLKKLIKILNEEDRMDEDWEHFTIHFDKVHSDFLVALKSHYPALSPNELKLCAYLRMNLSTKEIAQLMKISTRGVEISRYRLRKKLQMPKDANLFNFLLDFHGNI